MTAKRGAKDRFPSILEDAFHDPENCSIDPVAKVALSDDHQEFTWALSLLRSMYEFGRYEAGVFLIGLLMTCGDNWKKRLAIVESLYHVQTDHCVTVLFGEVKRVRNTNSTRRYLRKLVSVLSDMPAKLLDRKGGRQKRGRSSFRDEFLGDWLFDNVVVNKPEVA